MTETAYLFDTSKAPARFVSPTRSIVKLDRRFDLPPVTPVFDEFWRFAARRQAIFFQRMKRQLPPWTDDPILRRYKFTNAYRASDRVSQFLIRHVIYAGPQTAEDLFFRVLLFKIFNNIAAWRLLEREIGDDLCVATYDFGRYDDVLSGALARGDRIYSAAYIMPSPNLGERRKHQNHLRLLEMMLKDHLPGRLAAMASMNEVYLALKQYPGIGGFLAYQYATDLNYSILIDFDEDDFVVAGPGALDGIRKCFEPSGIAPEELIRRVTQQQEAHFERLGVSFQTLWGRRLKLIDCQNLFCEIGKYARVAFPHIAGTTTRDRIKQNFQARVDGIDYMYPPKWKLHVE